MAGYNVQSVLCERVLLVVVGYGSRLRIPGEHIFEFDVELGEGGRCLRHRDEDRETLRCAAHLCHAPSWGENCEKNGGGNEGGNSW